MTTDAASILDSRFENHWAWKIQNIIDAFPKGNLTRQELAEVRDELERLQRFSDATLTALAVTAQTLVAELEVPKPARP
jgi:hypothetical protein